jgi:hypothetical protein
MLGLNKEIVTGWLNRIPFVLHLEALPRRWERLLSIVAWIYET